jgi:hypothetical protein
MNLPIPNATTRFKSPRFQEANISFVDIEVEQSEIEFGDGAKSSSRGLKSDEK